MSQVWVIRAGNREGRQDYVLKHSCVAIGWGYLGDMSRYTTFDGVKEAVRAEMGKGVSNNKIAANASKPWRFAKDIKPGDWVILPLKEKGEQGNYCAVGEVTDEYRFNSGVPGCEHQLPVKWYSRDFPRESIARSLFNQGSVFRIEKGDGEISRALSDACPSAKAAGAVRSGSADSADIDVKQFIMDEFKEHAMQDLIAQILGAMGYDCEVSGKGQDGGVDIFASHRDFVDFVCVQVKAGEGKEGSPSLDRLEGAMSKNRVTKGLFVSWSGFGHENKQKEQRRSIRLWSADDVLRLVDEYYDEFDEDFKRKRLPLKRELVVDMDALESEDDIASVFRSDILINAPRKKVWDALTVGYPQWITAFCGEGARAVGEWRLGSEMELHAPGGGRGVVVCLDKCAPPSSLKWRYVAMLKDGRRAEFDENDDMLGVVESFRLTDEGGGTRLLVGGDYPPEMARFVAVRMPDALQNIKKLAEAKQ